MEFDFVTPKGVGAADRGKTHAKRERVFGNRLGDEHIQLICVCAPGRNFDIPFEVSGASPANPRDFCVAGFPFFIPTAIHHADGLIGCSRVFDSKRDFESFFDTNFGLGRDDDHPKRIRFGGA